MEKRLIQQARMWSKLSNLSRVQFAIPLCIVQIGISFIKAFCTKATNKYTLNGIYTGGHYPRGC